MTTSLNAFFANLGKDFYKCFLENKNYLLYLKGLRNTLLIAVGSCLLGLIIGVIVTCVRVVPKDKPLARVPDKIAGLYVTVIRGTPVVLQLFICYFVILKSLKSADFFGIADTRGIPVAIVAFGLNSGAYMAEILRGGINAVDAGQMEAGRTLGLTWLQTFIKIVLPQALKSAIPAMFNEFISLIKETSVAGYVGIVDLTKIQTYITVQTMQLFMPLFIIAAIYLVIVLGLQKVQKSIEARLNRSERRSA